MGGCVRGEALYGGLCEGGRVDGGLLTFSPTLDRAVSASV